MSNAKALPQAGIAMFQAYSMQSLLFIPAFYDFQLFAARTSLLYQPNLLAIGWNK